MSEQTKTNHQIGDIVVATDAMKMAYPGKYEDEYTVTGVMKNSLAYTGNQFIQLQGKRNPSDILPQFYGIAFKKK